MINSSEYRRIVTSSMFQEMEKDAYLGKLLPKTIMGVPAFPTFRNALAKGLKSFRKAHDKSPKLVKNFITSGIKKSLVSPDNGAVFVASHFLPIPSSLTTSAYSSAKKKIAKKITPTFMDNFHEGSFQSKNY